MLLALLLIPVTLTDSRGSHWDAAPLHALWWKASVARSSMVVIRIQAAVIYFHAAAAKTSEADWSNGSAIYYWLSDPVFGAPEALQGMIPIVFQHPGAAAALTWGTIVLEALLGCALLAERRWRSRLFLLGISFHSGIAVSLGLVTFLFPMAGLLVLYLLWPEHDVRMIWAALRCYLRSPNFPLHSTRALRTFHPPREFRCYALGSCFRACSSSPISL